MLRYTNSATLRDLSGGIGASYLVTALLLALFGGAGLAHWLLAGYWVIVWIAAASGCGFAIAVSKKWNSIRARCVLKWLAPVAGLASVAGCCLYDFAGCLNSDRSEDQSSVPMLECRAEDLQRTQVSPALTLLFPEKTIAETIEEVCGDVGSLEQKPLEPNQNLEVPLFNFSIGQDYSERIDQLCFDDARKLEIAWQNIRFRYQDNPQPYDNAEILVKP
ncbi:MAG: hypothetical protein GXY61_07260 [Lentisphaerae bacterium]|nr:hypothetical protein [Lentisphaerota bacterium]